MGCPHQDFIANSVEERNKYIKDRIHKTDLYISVYAFTEMNENGGLKRESFILDKSFSDFDPDYSENYIEDMKKLHAWCMQYDILHRAQFSGNGDHLFLFVGNGLTNPKQALGNFQRWLQQKLEIGQDTKIIGDTSRIFRYPNSFNFKGKRFCIPIPSEKIPTLTEEWCYHHATTQQHYNPWCGHKLLSLARWDTDEILYTDQIDLKASLQNIDQEIKIKYPEFPPCIQQMLSTPDLRDDGKFMLVMYLKDQLATSIPFDEKEIVSILHKTLASEEFAHYFGSKTLRGHPGHNGVKFSNVFKQVNFIMHSCKTLEQKGYCPQECGRDHPIY